MATPLRDHARLVDGPLEGIRLCLDRHPAHALVILAHFGDDTDDEDVVRLHYRRVIAPDGHASRDDEGFLLFYLAEDDEA